jgi:hypothetical protein
MQDLFGQGPIAKGFAIKNVYTPQHARTRLQNTTPGGAENEGPLTPRPTCENPPLKFRLINLNTHHRHCNAFNKLKPAGTWYNRQERPACPLQLLQHGLATHHLGGNSWNSTDNQHAAPCTSLMDGTLVIMAHNLWIQLIHNFTC